MAKYGELQKKYPDLEVWGHPAQYHDLYDLTVSGMKTATSSWYAEYLEDGEEIPRVGEKSIMLDNPDYPKEEVLLVTDKVVIERFDKISLETATCNAEGDCSIKDWKTIFGNFWREYLPQVGLTFDETGLVVTEFFHVEEV